MKNILLFLFIFGALFTTASPDLMAQKKKKKSKKEKAEAKKWKKQMKSMDPLKFKQMTEELNQTKGQVAGLKSQITSLENEKDQFAAAMSSKDEQINKMTEKFKELEEKCDNNVSASGDDYTKGVVYKVQVGAFREKNLAEFTEKGNFWMEDADGVKKYTIAYFRNYDEADIFKKYMREMGVKDAWIVAYEDNQRRDIKEVLDLKKQEGDDEGY